MPTPDNPAPANPAVPQEHDPAAVHRLVKRAIIYARQTRNKFALREVAAEMGLGRPGEVALGRFLKRETTDVAPATRRAFVEWARAHPAPDAQTQASGAAPNDYWLNM